MKQLATAAFLLGLSISPALAGSSTIAVTPGSGATYHVGTDGSTNFFGVFGLCDGAACANLASVTAAGTSGGYALGIQGVTGGVAVPVSQSGNWNVVNISGTVSLPTGAATSALQATMNTTLGSPFQAGGSIGNTGFLANIGTTNGWTPLRESALSTTVQAVKGSAGQLGMLQCYNPNSSQVYVQIFNVASGSVTLGSTSPTLSIAIAATSTGGFPQSNPGINFSSAISLAATTTAAGSTAPSTAPDCNVTFN